MLTEIRSTQTLQQGISKQFILSRCAFHFNSVHINEISLCKKELINWNEYTILIMQLRNGQTSIYNT